MGNLGFLFIHSSWQLVCWLVRPGENLLRGTVVSNLTEIIKTRFWMRVFVLFCWLITIILNKLLPEHYFVCWMRLLNFKAAKLQSKIIDRFHSRDQWLCKCLGTMASIYMRKEFYSHWKGRRFTVLHTKRTIARWRTFTTTSRILQFVVLLCKLVLLFFLNLSGIDKFE